ncbi:MAG: SMC-Scp complex subunit ScpB, partial [Oscillospiraceae bacterium]
MTLSNLQSAIESVLFSSGDPISPQRLAEVFEVTKAEIVKILNTIKDKYSSEDFGIELLFLNGNYQFASKLENASFVKKALEIKRNAPLSQAALEVLAVIAYNQPVTRSFVEQVRGVDSNGVMNTLIEKDLIEEAHRWDLPGRPISYRVTENFLRCFGLES